MTRTTKAVTKQLLISDDGLPEFNDVVDPTSKSHIKHSVIAAIGEWESTLYGLVGQAKMAACS